jgi:hypothetical protein
MQHYPRKGRARCPLWVRSRHVRCKKGMSALPPIATLIAYARAKMFQAVCKLSLEGIVSKNLDAPYKSGPSKAWLNGKLFCSLSLIKVCEVGFRLGFDARLGKQAHRLHHRDRLWVDNRAADVLYLDAMSHFVLDALLEFFRQQ